MPASTPPDHHLPPVTPTPDIIVAKQVFELASFTTTGGATISQVRVGWESYGALNEARDNAILVTHFFSGNSHAAGKYHSDEAEPGYWNAIIGPGKPLDTNRYCIISSDTLVNLNAKDPNTITTGPATIDPAAGKPYGMSFPIVTIRDFVNVQNALLDHLGIASLQAVVGASMGALQALEWGSACPDRVQRVIAVIGGAEENAFLIGWLELWAAPIRLDPNWNQGDYYGRVEPTRGLVEALKIVTLQASQWPWVDRMFGRAWSDEGKDPRAALEHRFAVEDWLERTAAARAAVCDANHFLYLVKANQLFLIGHGRNVEAGLQAIKAPVLLIASADDLVFPPQRHLRTLKDQLMALGKEVTYTEVITTDLGHLDGIAYIAKAGADIATFLAQSVRAKPLGSRS
jgi:homoserine O-acetyltransferase/O-succinyltransferase